MLWIKATVLVILLAAGGSFLIFAPRPSESLPKDHVIVEYWEKWTGNEAEAMRRIVDDFNGTVGREKRIYVRYLSMSRIEQKTLAACAAGVPPDIAGLIQKQIVQFAELGVLDPLEELASARGIGPETYKPIYWKACNYDGHLWCLISTPGVVALHYNKSILNQNSDRLRRAGLDPTRPPATIAKLDAMATVLDTRSEEGSIDRVGYLPSEPGWYTDFAFFWFGGEIFDPAAQKFTLDSPPNVACYEWVQSYTKRLGKSAVRNFRGGVGKSFASAQNPFLSQKVVMEQQGPWMANFILTLTRQTTPWKPTMSEALVPHEQEDRLPNRLLNYQWAVAPFPSVQGGPRDVTFADFDALVVPHGARHKAEAFEFIAYANRQEVMEKLNKLHCKNSPLRVVSDDFLHHHPNPYIEVFESLANSPNAHCLPQVAIWPEAHKELDDAFQSVVLLDATPAEALKRAQARLQAKLDAFNQRQAARKRALHVAVDAR